MQYLLTEEEFAELKKEQELQLSIKTEKLQRLCTDICDNYVLKKGWMQGKPWGCILSCDTEWYCDECVVKSICPHNDKRYSQ